MVAAADTGEDGTHGFLLIFVSFVAAADTLSDALPCAKFQGMPGRRDGDADGQGVGRMKGNFHLRFSGGVTAMRLP